MVRGILGEGVEVQVSIWFLAAESGMRVKESPGHVVNIIDRIQGVLLVGEALEFLGGIRRAGEAQVLHQASMGLLAVVDEFGTPFDSILERIEALFHGRLSKAFHDADAALVVNGAANAGLVPGEVGKPMPLAVCLQLGKNDGIVCFVKPYAVPKGIGILVPLKREEDLCEPVLGCGEGVLVVPGVGVDADIAEQVQAVLDPFADGNPVFVKDGACRWEIRWLHTCTCGAEPGSL